MEKKYVSKNDLKQDLETSKIQVAVFKLSKAGGLIESGYLALATEELGSGNWVEELQTAGSKLGKQPENFIEKVSILRSACRDGDVDGAKRAYISAAASLKEYAFATETTQNLKLL